VCLKLLKKPATHGTPAGARPGVCSRWAVIRVDIPVKKKQQLQEQQEAYGWYLSQACLIPMFLSPIAVRDGKTRLTRSPFFLTRDLTPDLSPLLIDHGVTSSLEQGHYRVVNFPTHPIFYFLFGSNARI
jgi:hypothetical protein